MGLFSKNHKDANFAGGSRNVMESIQREHDTGTLIYLDPRVDFNTNSVITVAPNEQVIFIKNGEFYGTLPSGRHEIKTENYPVLSRIRNMLTGGIPTFTCSVYHVNTSQHLVQWGTRNPIEIEDYHLGDGVPTKVRGAAKIRVRFNLIEDNDAAKQTFMELVGDKSALYPDDLFEFFEANIASEVADVIGKQMEERSKTRSINAISSQMKDFGKQVEPELDKILKDCGLELVDFSFVSLTIDEDEIRQKYIDRRTAAKNIREDAAYNLAVQQELQENLTLNPGAGGIASAGAGLGMGLAAGGGFMNMANNVFNPQQQPYGGQVPPQGYYGQQPQQGYYGQQMPPQQQAPQQAAPQQDPMEVLGKMKQMLDAGLISQQIYDAKVAEIMSRL